MADLLDQALVLGVVRHKLGLLFRLQSDHLRLQILLNVLQNDSFAAHRIGINRVFLGFESVDFLEVCFSNK